MKIINIIKGRFLERPNRFTVVFETDDRIEKAHLRDPGRLKELLLPEAHLLLRPAQNPANRKTKYDVIAVESEGIWVLINSGFHSDLAVELIESGVLPELKGYKIEKREYTYGKSRLDFLLTLENSNDKKNRNNPVNKNKMLLEVKGCTLVEEGHARFPDAPTERGNKHLEELISAKKEGYDSTVLFLIIREDAEDFSPNWDTDPKFSETLQMSQEQGVRAIAYSFKNILNEERISIVPVKRIPVKISSSGRKLK